MANKSKSAATSSQSDAISRLEDALAGMKRINPESVRYNRWLLELCCKTRYVLENEISELRGVEKEVDEFAENNPELISNVTLRSLSLAGEIERNFKLGDQAILEHDQKIEILRAEGYSKSEAAEQSPKDSLEEYLYELNEEINQFKTEQRRLMAFLKSKPNYNVDLLIGTEFEQSGKEESAS